MKKLISRINKEFSCWRGGKGWDGREIPGRNLLVKGAGRDAFSEAQFSRHTKAILLGLGEV